MFTSTPAATTSPVSAVLPLQEIGESRVLFQLCSSTVFGSCKILMMLDMFNIALYSAVYISNHCCLQSFDTIG